MSPYFRLSAAFLALSLVSCGEKTKMPMETPAAEQALDAVGIDTAAKTEADVPKPEKSTGLTDKVGWGQLTPERLNADPSISGPSLRGAKISPDGTQVTVLQGRADDARQQDLWSYDLETGVGKVLVSSTDLLGAPETLSDEEKNRRERMREYGSGIVSYQWAGDNQLLFPLGGDIFSYDLKGAKAQRVTETDGFETDAKVSNDGQHMFYVRANELYTADLKSGRETQLSSGGSETIRNATASFVVQEEFSRSTGYWVSPDASKIAYTQIDESPIAIENRIEFSADGIVNVAQRYPFAGTANATIKLGIVSRKGGEPIWVNLGEDEDIYLTRARWNADSSALWVGLMSRDQKTHTMYTVNPADGSMTKLFSEESDVWVNLGSDFKALKDGSFLWSSEQGDKRQIFNVSADGAMKAVTPDDLLVNSMNCVNEDSGHIYVTGWNDTPLERHIFKVGLDGTGLTQITKTEGRHSASFSKNCSSYIGYFSGSNTPPQTRAYKSDGSPLTWLNENALGAGHPYQPYLNSHISPEFGQVTAEDGTPLDYVIYKPTDMKDGETRPAITLVYGGPHAQRVHKGWQGGFPQMLADHGFVVFQLDNRGAGNRGKAFEAPLYRAMGGVEVRDQAVGAKWLRSQPYVDADRMGVYGWSYGGYMTLHMLAQTDDYTSGVSGAPVTDWALYDTAYTERYLGDPNPGTPNYTEGSYENGSVFAHIDGLTEPFLLIHGMADDNVVFRNSIKLMGELQGRGQQNFRLMTYPGEKHGFRNKNNRIHRDQQILNYFLETLGQTD